MAEVQNAAVVDRLSKETKESNLLLLPKKLAEQIQPVLIINDTGRDLVRDGTATNATVTIYTTPADKDFYLSFAQLDNDRGADGDCDVSVVVDGITSKLLNAASNAGKIGNSSTSLAKPLKIDRGTAITITSSVALLVAVASIVGFEVDTLEK